MLHSSRPVLFVAAAFFASSLFAKPQDRYSEPSPTATLKQRVGLTDIEITYSRPGLKGRKVFGERAKGTLETG